MWNKNLSKILKIHTQKDTTNKIVRVKQSESMNIPMALTKRNRRHSFKWI